MTRERDSRDRVQCPADESRIPVIKWLGFVDVT